MKINETMVRSDGTVEVVETEVDENYFDSVSAPPSSEERLAALEAAMLELVLGGAT